MHWIMWWVVIVRLIIGILGSFNQRNIKQLIAYSSIHHLGWIILVMEERGIRWLIYLGLYSVVLFRVVGLLIKDDVTDLNIMSVSKNKIVFIVGILRIAGMPPLLGFFLKWIALVKIVEVNIIYLMLLVAASVTILYVYMRIVYDVFIGGGVNICEDIVIFKKNTNVEVISVAGMMLGIIIGVIVMM